VIEALKRQGLRGFVIQLVMLLALVAALHWFASNVITNLQDANIASGFDFLNKRAGFPLSYGIIPYSQDSSFGAALLAGFANTVLMSLMCIVAASILGVVIALGRLSQNWLLRQCCLAYVEIFRNLPPLLVILFWYFGVFQELLPSVRESISLPFDIYINRRGFYFPHPLLESWPLAPLLALLLGLVLSVFLARFFKKWQMRSGQFLPKWPFYLLFLVVSPLCCLFFLTGISGISTPQPSTFNIIGGMSLGPEMMALFAALSLYYAALISETVRAGLLGVDGGIKEAAVALGLRSGLVVRLVTMPLALRIIIPPLASQYMNIIKNTSLAGAIGYQDIMSIGNSVIEKTNQSIEVVLIWILVYLGLSLLVSLGMNIFNQKMALKTR